LQQYSHVAKAAGDMGAATFIMKDARLIRTRTTLPIVAHSFLNELKEGIHHRRKIDSQLIRPYWRERQKFSRYGMDLLLGDPLVPVVAIADAGSDE
jgi:hypothetical protein